MGTIFGPKKSYRPGMAFAFFAALCLLASTQAVREECTGGAPVTGPCRGAFPRYFFNSATGSCDKFVYGGCGGTANNYKTEEACLAECKPTIMTRQIVGACSGEAPKIGPCKMAIRRYFFNEKTNKCEKFMWGGCQPGPNNYSSEGGCLHSCLY